MRGVVLDALEGEATAGAGVGGGDECGGGGEAGVGPHVFADEVFGSNRREGLSQ